MKMRGRDGIKNFNWTREFEIDSITTEDGQIKVALCASWSSDLMLCRLRVAMPNEMRELLIP
jgi:hypothetical protein